MYRDLPHDVDCNGSGQCTQDIELFRAPSSSCQDSRDRIRRLVYGWLKESCSPEDISSRAAQYRAEGWQIVASHADFDRVLLGVAESSWNFAISELLTSAAYFQASVSQIDLATVHRADIENAQSLLMLDSLEDLFRKVSDLSGSNMSSIGMVYLGWFLNLVLDFLSEKNSTTEFVLATTNLTTHFNHQIVALKGLLLRQSIPQLLTSRASVYLPSEK